MNIKTADLEKDLKKSDKTDKTVVFLGGECSDGNKWRKEIKKEYGKYFHFIDPYDKHWSFEENIYDEVAGLVKASWIFFYKPGEQSEQERKFLDKAGFGGSQIQEFDDIEDMKLFLKFLSRYEGHTNTGKKLNKCACALVKQAMPHISVRGKSVDLYLELMDRESIREVIEDFKSGKAIHIPEMEVRGSKVPSVAFSKAELSDSEYSRILSVMERMAEKKGDGRVVLDYDGSSHTYRPKNAKEGVDYEYACIKVDLPEDMAQEVAAWGEKNIPDEDLYAEEEKYGRENDIHITLFYGLKDDKFKGSSDIVMAYDPFEVRLGVISAFKDKDEYDVLKIEVDSGVLQKIHYSIDEKVENDNSYPTYSPHVTIAYVKKGAGNRHIGDETFRGKTFTVKKVVFSYSDDKRSSDIALKK